MRAEHVARLLVVVSVPLAIGLFLGACSWDLGKIFDRDDPQVEHARQALEASAYGGDADLTSARRDLEEVLEYRCEGDGGRDLVIDRPFASLDLGLVIFRISELVGRRFGEEEMGPSTGEEAESVTAARAKELDCAHLLLLKLANDPTTTPAMRLRARYLLGNFEFLSQRYEQSIVEYDRVLVAHPARGIDPAGEVGPPSDDDAVARDAAWNRAIALKRIHDKDAGSDSGPDADADSGNDGETDGDAGQDSDGETDAADASDSETPDAGQDSDSGDGNGDTGGDTGNDGKDTGGDAKNDKGDTAVDEGGPSDSGQDTKAPASPSQQPQPQSSAAPQPAPSGGIDLRELDRLEKQAPLDLDLPQKLKERKKLPKGLDK